ncbi:MAG: phosphoribosylformylglycinamidine synthase subunit PurS [Nitrospirales bacterium]|nr:phosphoribosylformylglycinamidine synthase subunit PurS [Nitrospirales bacterium]
MIKAKIFVTLKEGILDPQGRAVQQSLRILGFSSVDDVRIGKFLEVDVQETDKSAAEIQVQSMCERLLVNPVIENYRYELLDP